MASTINEVDDDAERHPCDEANPGLLATETIEGNRKYRPWFRA